MPTRGAQYPLHHGSDLGKGFRALLGLGADPQGSRVHPSCALRHVGDLQASVLGLGVRRVPDPLNPKVWGLGFRVWGLGFRVRVEGFGLRVYRT